METFIVTCFHHVLITWQPKIKVTCTSRSTRDEWFHPPSNQSSWSCADHDPRVMNGFHPTGRRKNHQQRGQAPDKCAQNYLQGRTKRALPRLEHMYSMYSFTPFHLCKPKHLCHYSTALIPKTHTPDFQIVTLTSMALRERAKIARFCKGSHESTQSYMSSRIRNFSFEKCSLVLFLRQK